MTFRDKVFEIVKTIPEGKIMTYGQVASMIGDARNARVVGWALRSLTINERNVPWWRVVNQKGYLSINHSLGGDEKNMQKRLLQDEGIFVNDEYNIEINKYLWRNK